MSFITDFSIPDYFRLGGWGMYPTLFLWLWSLAQCVRTAISRDKHRLPLVFFGMFACVGSGVLGFTTGVITTINYIQQVPPDERVTTFLIGLGESAHNIGLAFVLIIPLTLVTGFVTAHVRRADGLDAAV